jgi:hypothetical protein
MPADRAPRRPASAAPATAPMTAATATDPRRSGTAAAPLALTLATYPRRTLDHPGTAHDRRRRESSSVSSYADGRAGPAANGGMAQTTATAMSHYAYRAAIYRLAVDAGDPHRHQRRLTALSSSFAPPIGYEVAGEAMAIGAVDIG